MLMALLPLAGWAATDISGYSFTIETASFTYSAATPTINPTVTPTGTTTALAATNYDLVYYSSDGTTELEAANVKNVGTYYVAAKGKGEYEGTTTTKVQFTITAKSLEDASVGSFVYTACRTSSPTSATYDGQAWQPTATISLASFTLTENDYDITYGANVNAGTGAGTITYTGKGNFTGSKTEKFNIAAKDLPTIDIEGAYSFTATNPTYNGANVTGANLPTITIVDAAVSETALVENKDYELKWYSDASLSTEATPKNAGDYYLKIVGKGNYNTSSNISKASGDDAWKFNVKKKSVMVYVQSKEKIYDGQAIPQTNAGSNYYIDGVTISGTGLVASEKAEILATLKAQYTNSSYNASEASPKAAGEYEMTAVSVPASGVDIATNYEPDYTSFKGTYTIQKREVTVTAKNQTFTYNGSEQSLSTTIITTGDNATVTIENATATSTTGLVSGDDITTTPLFAISLKEGVTIKETTNEAYTGAILITATADAENSNYTIKGVAGNVIVNGKALKVVASNATAEYGAKVSDIDFGYLANPSTVELAKTPEYTLTNAAGEDVTESTDILPIGTYTIAIKKDATLAPTNYTLADDDYYDGELTITKKALEITINPLSLNTGATKATLNKYASTAAYTTVNNEEITFVYEFNTKKADNSTNNGITVNTDGSFTATASTTPYEAAIGAVMITNTADENYSAANANYDVTFVRGDLTVLGETTLMFDRTDTDLANKIKDASDVCAADATKKYTVAFGARDLVADQWYAMVLPFPTTVAEFSQKMGYAVVDILGAGSADGISLKLHMGAIAANQPFIFKVAEDKSLSGVTFEDKVITYVAAPEDADEAGNKFIGTYAAVTRDFAENEAYMKGGSWLFGEASDVTIQATGAYIVGASANAPKISIEEPNGNVTVINGIEANAEAVSAEGWYTINGVKLQAAPTQKGIYIFNGKKVAVK